MQIFAIGTGSESFRADLSNSSFDDNGGRGLLLSASDYEDNLAFIQNSRFLNNPDIGLDLDQQTSEVAMALISGSQASGNSLGIRLQQTGNTIGLVNLSGISANDNTAGGISNLQYSTAISIGVFGMPSGLGSSAGAWAGLLGGSLPEEVSRFLSSSGPVIACGNGSFGIDSTSQADGFLSLGAFIDILANDNLGDGVRAMIQAPDGIAVGLAGSTENWADILGLGTQLASQLLHINLPISISGNGHMEANRNGGAGFVMNTIGSNAAVNAVLGLDTIDNAGPGAVSFASADELALNAVARLHSISNIGAGLLLDVSGRERAALGLVADANVSFNHDGGITASADSDEGTAALLSLSIDALRPVAGVLGERFLDASISIPGSSFGPVVASDNGGNGFSATVTGGESAYAAFLDTQADRNDASGFQVSVTSASNQAFAAFASSDLLYEVLPDALDIDPIAHAPLGGTTANGNGANGISLTLNGYDAAMAILAGVEANANGSFGVHSALGSTDGGVMAYLVDVDASDNNAGIGMDVVSANEDISLGMVFVNADRNTIHGVHVFASSISNDVFALLADVDARQNGGNGVSIDLTSAEGDAAAALTDSDINANGGNGATFTLNANGYADLFVGDHASADFDDAYDYMDDVPEAFTNMIPLGAVAFNGNATHGLAATLNSATGSASMLVSAVTANHNVASNGIWFDLDVASGAGDALAQIANSTARSNGIPDVEGFAHTDAGFAGILLSNVVHGGYNLTVGTTSGSTDILVTP